MALAAAQVIDALAARLVPMVATGGRVYTSRAWPLTETQVPAWRVTAEDEDIDGSIGPANQHRLLVRASAYALALSNLDDALHALAASGLSLLFAPTVPHHLQLSRLRRRMDDSAEARLGAIDIFLTATFMVDPSQPETLLSP